jgi:hypothetical protein
MNFGLSTVCSDPFYSQSSGQGPNQNVLQADPKLAAPRKGLAINVFSIIFSNFFREKL